MDLIVEGLREAIRKIVALDPALCDAALRTLQVSGTATMVSLLIGVPAGAPRSSPGATNRGPTFWSERCGTRPASIRVPL